MVLLASAAIASGQSSPRVIWQSTPGSGSALPAVEHLAEMDGVVFFAGRDAEHGQELWRSDGTEAGTYLLKDIVTGKGSSFPRSFATAGGKLFFFASDMEAGFRLWSSDGTPGGTAAVAHIPSRSPNDVPTKMKEAGGKLFFMMPNWTGSTQDLWCSDGTAAGTVSVHFEGDGSRSLHEFQGDLLFNDISGDLWRSDGTVEGTRMLENQEDLGFWEWAVVSNKIYLGGDSLWVSDGMPGTARVPDFLDQRFTEQYIMNLSAHGGLLRFTARAEDADREWVSDGTLRGTVLLHSTGEKAPRVDWGESIAFKGRRLMSASTDKTGWELWTTSGTKKSTKMLMQLAPGFYSSYPANFVQTGKLAFFDALSPRFGHEIWSTSGTPLGTRLLTDVRRGKEGSDPKYLTGSGKRVFWTADDGKNGRQLWTSDGSKKGTRRLTSLANGGIPLVWASGAPGDGSALGLNGRYFFSGWESGSPSSLWRSDGTTAGTFALSTPSANGDDSSPSELMALGNRVYYETRDEKQGTHLWATDGTVAGTSIPLRVSLVDREQGWFAGVLGELGDKAVLSRWKYPDGHLQPARHEGLWLHAPGEASALQVMPGAAAPGSPGELLYLQGYDPTTGYEPWTTDGTLEGTKLLKDLRTKTIYDHDTQVYSSHPDWLGQAGGKTYFVAESFARGRELWVTDGTTDGTRLLKDIAPNYESSRFSKAYAWGSKLVFFATSSGFGSPGALWITDGTTEGTVMLMQAGQGYWSPPESHPGSMFAELNGKLIFPSYVLGQGVELWSSDGTPGGTALLKEIYPGQTGSLPQWITATATAVYFTAEDGVHGREMWRTDGTEAGTAMVFDPTEDAGGSRPWGLACTGGKLFFSAVTPDGRTAVQVIDEP